MTDPNKPAQSRPTPPPASAPKPPERPAAAQPKAAEKPKDDEPKKVSDQKENAAGSKLTSQSSSVAKVNEDGYQVLSNVVRDKETLVHEYEGEVKHPALEQLKESQKDKKPSRPQSQSSSYVKVKKDGTSALTNHLKEGEKTLAEQEQEEEK